MLLADHETQQRCAKFLNINVYTLKNWKKGEGKISVNQILLIYEFCKKENPCTSFMDVLRAFYGPQWAGRIHKKLAEITKKSEEK